METPFQNNSIFFVDVNKIKPNPFQPRIEFDNEQLESLSESIRMYGVLQPLVVTRKEVFTEEGGMAVEYELIAGERRLRASKLAGMKEVPVVIRSEEQTDQEKLELAIIENLQREDLNPVDRAKAFKLLADDFSLKHAEIGKRVGKSREYVSNSLRLLALPENILAALTVKKVSEGHARSLLMLGDRPEEQQTLFKEILLKGLTVRHTEKIARRVAHDKVRKKNRAIDPHTVEVEEEISEALGTRVHIERKAIGGKIQIDFFSEDDLAKILDVLKQHEEELAGDEKDPHSKMNAFIAQSGGLAAATGMVFEKTDQLAKEKDTTVSDQVTQQIPDVNEVVNNDEEVKEVEEKESVEEEIPAFRYASLSENNTDEQPVKEVEDTPEEESDKVEEIKEDPQETVSPINQSIPSGDVYERQEAPSVVESTEQEESPIELIEDDGKIDIDLDSDITDEIFENPTFSPVEQTQDTNMNIDVQEEVSPVSEGESNEPQQTVEVGVAGDPSPAQESVYREQYVPGVQNQEQSLTTEPQVQKTVGEDDLYGHIGEDFIPKKSNDLEETPGVPHYGADDSGDDLYRV